MKPGRESSPVPPKKKAKKLKEDVEAQIAERMRIKEEAREQEVQAIVRAGEARLRAQVKAAEATELRNTCLKAVLQLRLDIPELKHILKYTNQVKVAPSRRDAAEV